MPNADSALAATVVPDRRWRSDQSRYVRSSSSPALWATAAGRCRHAGLTNAACCCGRGRGVLSGFWPDAEGFRLQEGVFGSAGEAGLGDQPELAGAGGGLGAVGRAELAEQVGDVFLDGGEGDHEVVGDLLVGCAGGEQAQHLSFAVVQRVYETRDGGAAAAAGLRCPAGGRE